MRFFKKGEIYYVRLPDGYIRCEYLGSKKCRRRFRRIDGKIDYLLTPTEADRLAARVPRQKGALKRLAEFKKRTVMYAKKKQTAAQ